MFIMCVCCWYNYVLYVTKCSKRVTDNYVFNTSVYSERNRGHQKKKKKKRERGVRGGWGGGVKAKAQGMRVRSDDVKRFKCARAVENALILLNFNFSQPPETWYLKKKMHNTSVKQENVQYKNYTPKRGFFGGQNVFTPSTPKSCLSREKIKTISHRKSSNTATKTRLFRAVCLPQYTQIITDKSVFKHFVRPRGQADELFNTRERKRRKTQRLPRRVKHKEPFVAPLPGEESWQILLQSLCVWGNTQKQRGDEYAREESKRSWA